MAGKNNSDEVKPAPEYDPEFETPEETHEGGRKFSGTILVERDGVQVLTDEPREGDRVANSVQSTESSSSRPGRKVEGSELKARLSDKPGPPPTK